MCITLWLWNITRTFSGCDLYFHTCFQWNNWDRGFLYLFIISIFVMLFPWPFSHNLLGPLPLLIIAINWWIILLIFFFNLVYFLGLGTLGLALEAMFVSIHSRTLCNLHSFHLTLGSRILHLPVALLVCWGFFSHPPVREGDVEP